MTGKPFVRSLALVAILAMAGGCASTLPPVRLDGRPADLDALVGEWSGEYSGEGARDRSGSISFTLVAGENHAHGDVLMIPAGWTRAYERYRGVDPMPGRGIRPPAESLTIHFVRVEAGVVSGALDPYWDPDRQCWTWTTFRGSVGDGDIAGTFRSIYSRPSSDTTGQWKVIRHRAGK